MAQTPRGGLYGPPEPPSKGHHGVCAIYSETTVGAHLFWDELPRHTETHPK